jgi:hypothetical protein
MDTYFDMRSDYVSSPYDIINKVSRLNSWLNPKYKINSSRGVLGELTKQNVSEICSSIRQNGFYIFPNLLDLNTLTAIKTFAEKTPINYLLLEGDEIKYSKEAKPYHQTKNFSNRYQLLNISQFAECNEAMRLALDENFLHIANHYLGAKPILDLMLFWWSKSLHNLEVDEKTLNLLKDKSAQMFHFDLDRLKFIKFFVYLTDVDSEAGPHVYVKGTHNRVPPYIKADGRFSDELVEKHARDKIVEITGKAGTILAVDTRGLHKGKELEKGERLIFQLEFTNSMFGNPALPVVSEKMKFTGNQTYFDAYHLFFKK